MYNDHYLISPYRQYLLANSSTMCHSDGVICKYVCLREKVEKLEFGMRDKKNEDVHSLFFSTRVHVYYTESETKARATCYHIEISRAH